MEEYQKAIIQKNMNELAPMTSLFIYEELQSKNIPVYFDKTINPTDAKRKMFQDVQTQGDRAFYKLIEAMKESGNLTLAKILEDEDEKYTKTNKTETSSYSCVQVSQQAVTTTSIQTTGRIERKISSDQKPYVTPSTCIDTSIYEKDRKAIVPNMNQNQATQVPVKSLSQNIPAGAKQDTSMKRLDIKVKPSLKFLDDPNKATNKICPYPMRSKHRGVLLLITNINFKKHSRRGADVDERNLVDLFQQLGFIIYKFTDLKKKDMKQKIKDFTGKNNKMLKQFDCCFVIINSHGKSGRCSQETIIKTTDNKNIDTPWIIKQFDGNNCKALISKPKVLLFNLCRGDNEEKGVSWEMNEKDGKPMSKSNIPSQCDILLGYSTVPGYESNRNIYFGSWYIHFICEAFMNNAHDTNVEQMLQIANDKVIKHRTNHDDMQTAMIENRSFRPCFLHPNLIMENYIPVSLKLTSTVEERPAWDTSNDDDSPSLWSGCFG